MKIQVYSAIQLAQISNFFNAGGYVFDFTDDTFNKFTRKCIGIAVKSKYGQSKAKSLNAFFDDNTVAYDLKKTMLKNLLEYYEKVYYGEKTSEFYALCDLAGYSTERPKQEVTPSNIQENENDFVKKTFLFSVDALGLDINVATVIKQRLAEAEACVNANSPLASIILIGSIMEGVLLGMATSYPRQFNQSTSAPKNNDTGKVKNFPLWSLNNFIDVACDIGLLKENVKKFSHAVRDFRNYIHPYEQMSSRFYPDKQTALICLQVLKAAISQIEEFRKTDQA